MHNQVKWVIVVALTDEQKKKLQEIENAVRERITGPRLEHVLSVADTAAELANVYGVDEFLARAAGLLHDWDKQLSGDELLSLVNQYEITLPDDPNKVMPLIHSWTGAFSTAALYPELPAEVFIAISRHTTGALSMTDLDMVLYVADMIEPTRNQEKLRKIAKKVGKLPLSELYMRCYTNTMCYLFENRRYVYMPAVEIWNGLIEQYPARPNKKKKGKKGSKRTANRKSRTGEDNPATKKAKKLKKKK